MGKPRFQALVDLYAAQEDEARKRVGALEYRRADAQQRVADNERERAAAGNEVSIAFREAYAAYWRLIGDRIRQIRAEIVDIDRQIVEAREQLIAVHRQHATFTRLRDRDLREQRVRRDRQAAKALDDHGARQWREGVGTTGAKEGA